MKRPKLVWAICRSSLRLYEVRKPEHPTPPPPAPLKAIVLNLPTSVTDKFPVTLGKSFASRLGRYINQFKASHLNQV